MSDHPETPRPAPRPAGWPPRPPGPGLVERWWGPPPAPAPGWLPLASALVGLVAAGTVAQARPGMDVAVVAAAIGAVTALLARHRRDRTGLALLALAVGLAAVAAVRDSAWLVACCLLAAVGTASVAGLGGRSWPALLLSAPVLALDALPGVAWSVRGPAGLRRPPRLGSWVRGVVLATVLVALFEALLAAADPFFALLARAVWPSVRLPRLPLQVAVLVLAVALLSALAHSAASSPRWDRLSRPGRHRPAAEWVLPLAGVDAVLLAFGAVQAAALFGGYTAAQSAAGVTYAERARQGFGQLVAVTVLTAALLGWAGRRADPRSARHRTLLAGTGGLLVVLAIGVVASALRRMWLYEQAYGWTVLRLCVAAFELWLGAILVLIAAAWAVRRTALVPRGVAVSAATALLVLAMAGPDALVARWNVDRFRDSGKIDVEYLSRLSADAVPALACLREPYRTQVLGGRQVPSGPWYAANLARGRAAEALADPGAAGCGRTASPGSPAPPPGAPRTDTDSSLSSLEVGRPPVSRGIAS